MVDIRLCLILDGRLYARLECLECYNLYVTKIRVFMHQSIPPAPSTPPGYCGAFACLVSPGGGAIVNFALPGGRAFANPSGHSRAFDTHTVSYQNITTQKVLLEKKQIGSSVKDRNKL